MINPTLDLANRIETMSDNALVAFAPDLIRELRALAAPSSVATGAGPDVLTVKELHDRANVCTRNAYQHRKEGQEMSAQFHLGAAMAFRDMADKLSSAPVPLPDAAPSPWRETEIEMPAEHERVLAWYPLSESVFTGSHDGGWFYGPGGEEPTHWMPLPDPPGSSSASPAKERP